MHTYNSVLIYSSALCYLQIIFAHFASACTVIGHTANVLSSENLIRRESLARSFIYLVMISSESTGILQSALSLSGLTTRCGYCYWHFWIPAQHCIYPGSIDRYYLDLIYLSILISNSANLNLHRKPSWDRKINLSPSVVFWQILNIIFILK